MKKREFRKIKIGDSLIAQQTIRGKDRMHITKGKKYKVLCAYAYPYGTGKYGHKIGFETDDGSHSRGTSNHPDNQWFWMEHWFDNPDENFGDLFEVQKQ